MAGVSGSLMAGSGAGVVTGGGSTGLGGGGGSTGTLVHATISSAANAGSKRTMVMLPRADAHRPAA